MNIVVIGAGYVGLSIATIMAIKNNVVIYDVNNTKVDLINQRIVPFKDEKIEEIFSTVELKLKAVSSNKGIYEKSDYVIIALPTNLNEMYNRLDTELIEKTIDDVFERNSFASIIIKSTVPIGFTKKMNDKYNCNRIAFSPEFLREGTGARDLLFPDRIILGTDNNNLNENLKCYLDDIEQQIKKKNVPVFCVSTEEAEAIKLFSNTYLAMRICFFNELDKFCEERSISTKNVINGVCSDSRIGNYYNNPSFGFGGYCLPKDSQEIASSIGLEDFPVIKSIPISNEWRKKSVSSKILSKSKKIIGIYRLVMKEGSDNFRESSILDVLENIKKDNSDVDILIYEPLLSSEFFKSYYIEKDLDEFKKNQTSY